MAVWYCRDNSTFDFVTSANSALTLGSVGWSAMTGWSSGATIAAGAIIRQSAGQASFTASQSTTVLTVTAVSAGTLYVGMVLQASSATSSDKTIASLGTGTGGTGTYNLSQSVTVNSTTWIGGFSVLNPRTFVAIVAGTTGSTEPNWVLTKGAKTTDNTVTWMECTGQPGVNGDITNPSTWPTSTSVALGFMIYDSTSASLQIVSTAGTTSGSKPTFSATAGVVTSDGATVKWTSLGLASGFGTWAAPFAFSNLVSGTSWAAAGDTIYFGDDHSEILGVNTYTITINGTDASPNFIYSIDHTLSLPVSSTGLKAGATIATRLTTALNIGTGSVGGHAYFYGITFSAGGSGAGNASLSMGAASITDSWMKFDTCALQLSTTNINPFIVFGGGSLTSQVELTNTTMQFGSTSQSCKSTTTGKVIWRNTPNALVGATIPTTLFTGTNDGVIIIEGVDLSAAGSGKTLVAAGVSNGANGSFSFMHCKLGSSVTIAATPANQGGPFVDAMLCDSGATGYIQRRYWYQGTLQEETTIVRTGGATDGVTPISWKIVTTANSKWVNPFEAFPISIWNAKTAANVTVTLHGIWGGGAVPNTDDIWMDVVYMGSSASPMGSFATTTKANNLASGTGLTSDGVSAWGGSTTAFSMAVTLNSPQPQIAGYLNIYVKAAKATSTFYIDPLPVLS